ncbi:MAG: hypothetical protein HY072_09050 [Deltaproteobacteria bacterium]|nr:hypothetical protein [Deltaproteobacteria bacterium]MBI4926036.1 hypothetical protein [Bdellovibrio sp.]
MSKALKIKRITANLPEDLVNEAIQVTKTSITDTLIAGLRLVRRTVAFEKAQALKGKLNLKINLDVSRERNHR